MADTGLSQRDDLIDKLSVATVILDAVLPFVGASSSDLLAMTVDQARQSADSIASKFNGHEQKVRSCFPSCAQGHSSFFFTTQINDLHTTLARSQEQLSTFSSFIESLRSCAHFPRPLLSTLDAFLAGATTPAQLAESFRPASLLGIVHLEMRSRHIASKLRHAECTIAELQNAGNENVAALIATRKEMEPVSSPRLCLTAHLTSLSLSQLEEEAAVVRDELVPLINSLLKLLHPAQAQAQALDTGASPLVPALCATLRKVNTFVKHSFTPSVLSLPEEYDLRNREKQQGNDEIARLLTQKRQLKKQLVQLEALLKQQGDSSSKLIKRSKLKARLADKDAQLADKEVELALVKQQLADEQKQREHCDQRIASVKRALDIGAERSVCCQSSLTAADPLRFAVRRRRSASDLANSPLPLLAMSITKSPFIASTPFLSPPFTRSCSSRRRPTRSLSLLPHLRAALVSTRWSSPGTLLKKTQRLCLPRALPLLAPYVSFSSVSFPPLRNPLRSHSHSHSHLHSLL